LTTSSYFSSKTMKSLTIIVAALCVIGIVSAGATPPSLSAVEAVTSLKTHSQEQASGVKEKLRVIIEGGTMASSWPPRSLISGRASFLSTKVSSRLRGGRKERLENPAVNPQVAMNFSASDVDRIEITLRGGRDGKFCADEGNRVVCDRERMGPWEYFTIRGVNNGKISLQGGKNRKYCSDDAKDGMKCFRDSVRSWEEFELKPLSNNNGKYALVGGRDGKYCADEENGIRCNRNDLGPWEQFDIFWFIVLKQKGSEVVMTATSPQQR